MSNVSIFRPTNWEIDKNAQVLKTIQLKIDWRRDPSKSLTFENRIYDVGVFDKDVWYGNTKRDEKTK